MRYFFLLLSFSFLFANDYSNPYLASDFNGDQIAVVDGKVNAITGDLIIDKEFMVIRGLEPIVIPQVYVGRKSEECQRGWRIFNSLYLTYRDGAVHYTMPNGKALCFRKIGEGASFSLDEKSIESGVTNTFGKEPDGRANLRHIRLEIEEEQLIVILPDGMKQFFSAAPQGGEPSQYVLVKEIKPNGNRVFYDYTTDEMQVRVARIRTMDVSETVLFAAASFSYEGRDLIVRGSDGQEGKVRLSRAHVLNAAVEEKSASYMPDESFTYTSDLMMKRWLRPDFRQDYFDNYEKGRFQKLVNGKKIEGDASQSGRICNLKKIIDKKKSLTITHSFDYKAKEALQKGGSTTVTDYDLNTLFFQYDKFLRPLVIEHHSDRLLKEERFAWGKGSESSYLIARTVVDSDGVPLSSILYIYDESGNVIEKKLFGNLSGRNEVALVLDEENMPVENGVETYSIKTEYNEQNLPVRIEEESGKVTLFSYLPDTHLVAKKEVCDRDHVLITESFTYQWGTLVKKVTQTENERLIERIDLIESGPFTGLPYARSQYGHNFAKGKDELIKKEVLHYDERLFVVQRDIHDSNDAFAYSLFYIYDEKGRLVSETNSMGQTARYAYDANFNKIKEIPFSNDQKIDYVYDFANRLVSKEQQGNETYTTQWERSTFGNLVIETQMDGRRILHAKDPLGRTFIIKELPIDDFATGEKKGGYTLITHDANGNPIAIKDPEDHIKRVTYNYYGKPIHIVHGDGTEEKFTYALNGALESHTDQEGNVTTYEHDLWGNITSIKTALTTEKFTYDPFGKLLSHTDGNGTLTRITYNAKGQKARETHHGTQRESTSFAYDALGNLNLIKQHESDPLITRYTYDLSGNRLKEVKENGTGKKLFYVTYTYDAAGNRSSESKFVQGNLATTHFNYDILGRLTATTDPMGHVTTVSYPQGEVLTKVTTDPQGIQTIEIFNAHGKIDVLKKMSPNQELLSHEKFYYNLNDQLTHQESTILPSGKKHLLICERDTMGRITARIEAAHTKNPRVTRFTYTPRGFVEKIKKPDGIAIHKSYDELGRNISIMAPDIHYTFTYDHLGNLTSSVDHVQSVSFSRILDSKGRILSERLPSNQMIAHTYNALGQKTSTTLPTGKVSYIYDPLHLRGVSYKNQSHIFKYDTSGNLIAETLPFKLGKVERRFDLNENITTVQTPVTLQENLVFDAGNRLCKTHWKTPYLDTEVTYSYNDLGQLLSEEGPISHTYTYDSHSNRTSIDENVFALDDLEQMTSKSYDSNGNPLVHKEAKLTYDALDRVIRVDTPEATYRYKYDGINRRMLSNHTYFLYDDQVEIGTTDCIRILGANGTSVFYDLKNYLYVPIYDSASNPTLLLTSSGHVKEAIFYSAFGEEHYYKDPLFPWRFASMREDPETSLLLFGKRYYDPETGRFLTRDPKTFVDNLFYPSLPLQQERL